MAVNNASTEMTDQARNAGRTASVFLIAVSAAILIYFYVAFQTGAWQLYGLMFSTVILLFITLFSIRLSRAGQIEKGILMLLVGLQGTGLAASILVNELGLYLGVAIVIVTLQIGAQTLWSSTALKMTLGSIGAAVVMGVLGWLTLPFQFIEPRISTYTLILAGLIVTVYTLAIIRAFPAYPLRIKVMISFLAVSLLSMAAVAFSIFLPIQTQARTTLLVTIVMVGVVTSLAIVLAQSLVVPILSLTSIARRVAAGELKLEASIESQDEIGQLAAAFNAMTGQLRTLIGNLEAEIQARTTELVLSMAVGQRATALRELDQLLPTISEFIRELFDLYYTQVYFVDDLQHNLILQYGTGEIGGRLVEQGHKLPIDDTSIVGHVAHEGQAIVVADTARSTIHKPNPLLPETRSELAVPLLVEGKVIGVLDMQARTPETFTEKNLPVFEAMAIQLAGAIDSATQWGLARQTQVRLETMVRQFTREGWALALGERRQDKVLGFDYDLVKVRPLSDERESIPMEATAISASLVVQNQPIGQIVAQLPPDQPFMEDTRRFLEAVGEQIAQKAETLRLLEEIQRQAGREQLTRQIADRIRASSDIETALRTATAELLKALGAARASLDFKVLPTTSSGKQATGNGSTPQSRGSGT